MNKILKQKKLNKMTTRDYGMGFHGRHHFDMEAMQNFRAEWSKMTDSEKLEFMNKKMDSMNFEDRFSVEAMDARCEEWMKKTPDEKEAFVKERKEAFQQRCAGRHFQGHGGFHGRGGFGFFGDRQESASANR